MARSLVQALEGVSFPADRTQLIDHARRNEATSKALQALEGLPSQQFRSMTELFGALPAKSARRRRSQQTLQQVWPKPEAEQPRQRLEAEEEPPPDFPAPDFPKMAEPLVPEGLPPDPARLAIEMWQQWFGLAQRLWFPWLRP